MNIQRLTKAHIHRAFSSLRVECVYMYAYMYLHVHIRKILGHIHVHTQIIHIIIMIIIPYSRTLIHMHVHKHTPGLKKQLWNMMYTNQQTTEYKYVVINMTINKSAMNTNIVEPHKNGSNGYLYRVRPLNTGFLGQTHLTFGENFC